MNRVITALFLCWFANLSVASVNVAISNGDWNEAAVWSNGVPGCFDTIVIPAGVQIDITATIDLEACPDSIVLFIYGDLFFQTGKKLKLPCLSDVLLFDGAFMGVGGGGGASTYLEICGTEFWNASLGDLIGPVQLCDGGCPPSQLPIELLFFNALLRPDERVVSLHWQTVSETDNDYFSVERSKNGMDWEEVMQVDGAGTSLDPIDYYQVDENPLYGQSYYRLKQTDFNGDFSYSPAVSIYQGGGTDMIVYPNPVISGNSLNVDFSQLVITFPDVFDKALLVEITTVEGKLMYTRTIDLTQTKQIFVPIDDAFASGIYIVKTAYQNTRFVVE